MTTFRTEVVQTGQDVEVDYTNPLSQYLQFAVVPSAGVGDSVVDVVSGDSHSFLPGSVVWNSDGSVSTNAYNNFINLPSYDDKNLFERAWLITLEYNADIDTGADARNPIVVISDRTSGTFRGRDSLGFVTERYGDALSIEAANSYSLSSFSTFSDKRDVLAIAFDPSTKAVTFYKNNSPVFTGQLDQVTGETWQIFYFGLGNPSGKLYSASLFRKDQSFTDEEIESIVSDPYQVFKTQEDILRENHLKVDGVTGSYVSLVAPMGTTGDRLDVNQSWRLSFGYHVDGDTTKVHGLFDNTTTDTASLIFRRSDQLFRLRTLSSGVISAANMTPDSNGYHEFDIVKLKGSNTYEFYLNGDLQHTESGAATNTFSADKFYVADGHISQGGFKYVSFTDYTTPANNRFYDFNQSNSQGYVPELINGQHGTLVGFPEPSGYVRELDSHQGVKFDGINDYATTDITNLWQNDSSFCFEFDFYYTGQSDQTLAGDPFGFNNNILITSPTTITVRMVNASKDLILNEPLTVGRHLISFRRNVFENFGAYDSQGNLISAPFGSTGGGFNMHGFGAQTNSGFFRQFNGTIYSAKFFTDFNATQLKHHWDFTKTSGLTVPDLVGSLDATLVGFDNVYYRPEASGELIGYRFERDHKAELATPIALQVGEKFKQKIVWKTTTSASANWEMLFGFYTNGNDYVGYNAKENLRIRVNGGSSPSVGFSLVDGIEYVMVFKRTTSAYELYVDDLTTPLASVETNFQIDNLIGFGDVITHSDDFYSSMAIKFFEHLSAEDELLGKWDFTTGDADQIIDTVGNNHATITNTPTSGFLPLIEKQVFTVGNVPEINDYSLVTSAILTEAAQTGHRVLLFREDMSIGANEPITSINSWGSNTVLELTSDKKFDGSRSSVPTIYDLRNTRFLYPRNGTGSGILVNNLSIVPEVFAQACIGANDFYGDYVKIENCYVEGGGIGGGNTIDIKNSVINNTKGSRSLNFVRDITDNVLIATGTLASNGQAVRVANSLVNNLMFTDYSEKTVSSTISYELNNKGYVLSDLDAVFADPTNGDFRIKQSYAEAQLPEYDEHPTQYGLVLNDPDELRQYVILDNPISLGDEGDYVEMDIELLSYQWETPLLGYYNSWNNILAFRSSRSVVRLTASNGNKDRTLVNPVTQYSRIKIKLVRVLQTYKLYINEILEATYDNEGVFSFNQIAQIQTAAQGNFKLYSMKVGNGEVLKHHYYKSHLIDDTNDTLLPDAVSGNDGTVVMAASGNEHWGRIYANLKDQGWNGTDIAGWAYYDDAAVTEPPIDSGATVSLLFNSIAQNTMSTEYRKYLQLLIAGSAELQTSFTKGQEIASILETITTTQLSSMKGSDTGTTLESVVDTQLNSIKESITETILIMNSDYTNLAEVSKSAATRLELVDSVSSVAAVSKILSSQTINSSIDTDLLVKCQKVLSIVVDSIGSTAVQILSDTIKEAVASIVISSSTDSSVSLLAAKATSIVSLVMSTDLLIQANKHGLTSISADSKTTTEVVPKKGVSETIINTHNTSTSADVLKGSIVDTEVLASTTGVSNYIEVYKYIPELVIESASTSDIIIDIGKQTATFLDTSTAESINVDINKTLGTITVESNTELLIVTLNNFTDSNIIKIDSSILMPNTTINTTVKTPSRVIDAVIRIK